MNQPWSSSGSDPSISTQSPTGFDNVDLAARARARRPKAQLSCVPCRAKKQKCDRNRPCKNCSKVAPTKCIYVAQSPSEKRLQEALSNHDRTQSGRVYDRVVYNRVQLLEQKVAMLANPTARLNDDSDSAASLSRKGSTTIKTNHNDLPEDHPPRLAVNEEDPHFVSSSHWESILDDIAGIKQELGAEVGPYKSPTTPGSDLDEAKHTSFVGPVLLLEGRNMATLEELICCLPPKPVVYALIRQYAKLNGIPPLLPVALHLPTFVEEVDSFWEDPQSVTLPWLAHLFAICSLALQSALGSGLQIEGVMFQEASARLYTVKAAEALLASDYMKPQKGTLESMIFYLACEHYWISKEHFRASMIYSLIVRVAHRMGYHRDPRHYPHMSIFQAEMRRRTWSLILQMDLFLAGKCGLPRLIGQNQTDTAPPLNLKDEDLLPSMLDVPIPRPDSEFSLVGYLNYKTRLMIILGRINDMSNGADPLSYDEVMQLEHELVTETNTRYAWLEPPSKGQPINCPMEYLGWVIDVDLIVQRARMILFRRFVVPSRQDSILTSLKDRCLLAAKRTIDNQGILYAGASDGKGGLLENWRLLTLNNHDYLMAAMILSLEIEQAMSSARQPIMSYNEKALINDRVQSHLAFLKTSYDIWTACLDRTSSAQEAHSILKSRLEHFHGAQSRSPMTCSPITPQHHQTSQSPQPNNLSSLDTFTNLRASTPGQGYQMNPQYAGPMPIGPVLGADMSGYGSEAMGFNEYEQVDYPMGDISLENINWAAWDSNFYGSMMPMY